jgi:hypothetical protein
MEALAIQRDVYEQNAAAPVAAAGTPALAWWLGVFVALLLGIIIGAVSQACASVRKTPS